MEVPQATASNMPEEDSKPMQVPELIMSESEKKEEETMVTDPLAMENIPEATETKKDMTESS